MNEQDKQLLLQDLCARLPYGIVINTGDKDLKLDRQHQGIGILYPEDCSDEFNERNNNASFYITISGCYYGEDIKPYLRPMSSMTKEEFIYFMGLRGKNLSHYDIQQMMKETFNMSKNIAIVIHLNNYLKNINWLLSKHFDINGLIEKGLAIKVTKENNPYKD